jgi:hypothetical protein
MYGSEPLGWLDDSISLSERAEKHTKVLPRQGRVT